MQVGDGYAGLPQLGPFDAIHVGAAAPAVPQALLDQLARGGRLIIPVGQASQAQQLMQCDKGADGAVATKALLGVQYVPLTTRSAQEATARLRGEL